MPLHDPIHDRQPEPGPFANRLGGKKRLENMIEMVRRDPAAVVLDLDPHDLVVVAGAHDDRPFAFDGMCRIDEQIQEDLVDLRRQAI